MMTCKKARRQQTSKAPLLSVRNGAKAIEFYAAAPGAGVARRHDDQFWLANESPQHANFSPESLGDGTVRVVMVAENPDTAFERAVSAGATVVWPVGNQHGWRLGRIVDPFGRHWAIGKPLRSGS